MLGEFTNTQLTRPPGEPQILAIVKKSLAIDHDDDDDRLYQRIASARRLCEKHTDVLFGSRQFKLKTNCWPFRGVFHFPVSPVTAITSVKYSDVDEVVQTIDPTNYRTWLEANPPQLRLITGYAVPALSQDAFGGIEVEYTAGHVEVPEELPTVIDLIVGYWDKIDGGLRTSDVSGLGIPPAAKRMLDTMWTGGL